MSHLKILLFLLIIGASSAITANSIPSSERVNICAEDTGWPPFSILETIDGQGTGKLKGKNLELIEKIFEAQKIKYQIHIKPWKRCLYEGIHGNIQIVLDAATNAQRRSDYLISDVIYTLSPVYFYSKKSFQNGLQGKTSTELKKLGQGCGQVGYIYDNFGFKADELNLQAKDLPSLLSLVAKKRCAFALGRLEPFLFEKENSNNFNDVDFAAITSAKKEDFYWLINKNFKYANSLKKIIDTKVQEIRNGLQAKTN